MKVLDIEAGVIDILGYVLPGAAVVAIHLMQNPVSVGVGLWDSGFFAVSLGLGYVLGGIMAAFQTQTLGRVCDVLCGHRRDALLQLNGARLSWFARSVLDV